jgi:hypothetical protein
VYSKNAKMEQNSMSSIFFSLWGLKLQTRGNFNETPENCQIILAEKNSSESLYLENHFSESE